MSSIVDRMRIDKAGNVSYTAEPIPPTTSPTATAWSHKGVLADIVEISNPAMSASTAKDRVTKFLVAHKADRDLGTLLNWMNGNWQSAPIEKRIYNLVLWYAKRLP